jgi:hypothetical protein
MFAVLVGDDTPAPSNLQPPVRVPRREVVVKSSSVLLSSRLPSGRLFFSSSFLFRCVVFSEAAALRI